MQTEEEIKHRNNIAPKPLINGQFHGSSLNMLDEPDDSLKTEIKSNNTNIIDFMNQNQNQLSDTDTIVNNLLGGFASSIGVIGRGVVNGFKINNSKIKGDDKKEGILQQLIGLVLGIVTLPVRFFNLFKSVGYAGAALGVGIAGIAKSIKLGTTDIYLLIVVILKMVIKYISCIISFWITTTFGGCLFVHIISLFFIILRLCIMVAVDFFIENLGMDFTFIVDDIFEYIKWPKPIQTLCYTCFGKPVKLSDVFNDVDEIEKAGQTIAFDFNNTMPKYMLPSVPYGTKSLKSLDKAMN
jgi:hypothetical protein